MGGAGPLRVSGLVTQDAPLPQLTLRRDPWREDFGFSVSDGIQQAGVFVHSVRPQGPAQRGGLRPLDRVLQVRGRVLLVLRVPSGVLRVLKGSNACVRPCVCT